MDAKGLFDPSLHFGDDVEDVLGRGMARIDDEAGMFRRYLGIAAGQALKSVWSMRVPAKISRRPLKVLPALCISRGCRGGDA